MWYLCIICVLLLCIICVLLLCIVCLSPPLWSIICVLQRRKNGMVGEDIANVELPSRPETLYKVGHVERKVRYTILATSEKWYGRGGYCKRRAAQSTRNLT